MSKIPTAADLMPPPKSKSRVSGGRRSFQSSPALKPVVPSAEGITVDLGWSFQDIIRQQNTL
jgi:hypothetical protein